MIKLVPNSGRVARYSHSLHLNILSLVCWLLCIADVVWPMLGDYLKMPPLLFIALAGLFTALAIPARFVLSKQLSGASHADR
ncbi:hypothetical protein EN780_31760 [Mesorhizobium sp. M4B.F.Ca.ET.089.01.1.1]|uniref:hypothetical protein n=1 Tax=Mesorhizobium sp. M4B.F.Ca.ET.089.01.1.1 TaxID=2496662 RepID=UPI000FE33B66|nr:hypothetical protein [Mesorhizobium sp. M4B.F.Ca.ET.089.01.1.1]RWX60543.1 hypothetical protein EN780_31760 [Mesorhizobium sp. M4B.F.Ca.ET.089.01.1.1]